MPFHDRYCSPTVELYKNYLAEDPLEEDLSSQDGSAPDVACKCMAQQVCPLWRDCVIVCSVLECDRLCLRLCPSPSTKTRHDSHSENLVGDRERWSDGVSGQESKKVIKLERAREYWRNIIAVQESKRARISSESRRGSQSVRGSELQRL